MIEESWSLERFLSEERFRNVFDLFLWDVPLTEFKFVGLTEEYDAGLAVFRELFDLPALERFEARRNPERIGAMYEVSAAIEERFRELNHADYRLYEEARLLFRGLSERVAP